MAESNRERYLKKFGRHLAELRESKNFSQAQLSYEAGMDVMTISRIERGVSNISIVNALKIAKALGVDHKELYNFPFPE